MIYIFLLSLAMLDLLFHWAWYNAWCDFLSLWRILYVCFCLRRPKEGLEQPTHRKRTYNALKCCLCRQCTGFWNRENGSLCWKRLREASVHFGWRGRKANRKKWFESKEAVKERFSAAFEAHFEQTSLKDQWIIAQHPSRSFTNLEFTQSMRVYRKLTSQPPWTM